MNTTLNNKLIKKMEKKKELKKKKERRNKIAIISLLIFLCFTISNAQEHCDFEDFIKEKIGYLNGGFGSKGRLNLGKIKLLQGLIIQKTLKQQKKNTERESE